MDVQKELERWKADYKNAKTAEEIAESKKRFGEFLNSLELEDKKAFVMAFQSSAKQAISEAKSLAETVRAREKLVNVLNFTSMSYIAKNYFGKSRQWLYQRINGSMVNGKPVYFTKDDLAKLSTALSELGDTMKEASNSLRSFSTAYDNLDK